MKTMKSEANRTKKKVFYLSLLLGMMLICIPDVGLAQGPLYREIGKRTFDTAALFPIERVSEYGLEDLFGKMTNRIHADPIRILIYNPYNAEANFAVTENGKEWYDLRVPRGYYVQVRTEYYPMVAMRTPHGLLYYLTSPGSYTVPPNALEFYN